MRHADIEKDREWEQLAQKLKPVSAAGQIKTVASSYYIKKAREMERDRDGESERKKVHLPVNRSMKEAYKLLVNVLFLSFLSFALYASSQLSIVFQMQPCASHSWANATTNNATYFLFASPCLAHFLLPFTLSMRKCHAHSALVILLLLLLHTLFLSLHES